MMEYYDIRLEHIPVSILASLLSKLEIGPETVERCHFFIDQQDVYCYEEVAIDTYFVKPATGLLFLKTVCLGTILEDVVIILSGKESIVEMTLNFPRTDNIDQNLELLKLALLDCVGQAQVITFGFEPLSPEDVIWQFKL